MPIRKLIQELDRHDVKYVLLSHSPAFTAQEVAESAHIPGKELAKTVVVKLDGRLAMAVLPASRQVDFDKFRDAAGVQSAVLAHEEDFQDVFPDCEVGAMPPFGYLYSLPVYVDPSLTEDEEIAFTAGSHRELLKLTYNDFEEMTAPHIAPLAAGA